MISLGVEVTALTVAYMHVVLKKKPFYRQSSTRHLIFKKPLELDVFL